MALSTTPRDIDSIYFPGVPAQTPKTVYMPAHTESFDWPLLLLWLVGAFAVLALGFVGRRRLLSREWHTPPRRRAALRRRGRAVVPLAGLSALLLALSGLWHALGDSTPHSLTGTGTMLRAGNADPHAVFTTPDAAIKAARIVRADGATAVPMRWQDRPRGWAVCSGACSALDQAGDENRMIAQWFRTRYGLHPDGEDLPMIAGSALNQPRVTINDLSSLAAASPGYRTPKGSKVTCAVKVTSPRMNALGQVVQEHLQIACADAQGAMVQMAPIGSHS